MATRTVRLDDEDERNVEEIRHMTGLSISDVLKRGILTLRAQIEGDVSRTPYEIYRELDLGLGGYANAPSTQSRAAARNAIQRRLERR
jgi:hypothetical protein